MKLKETISKLKYVPEKLTIMYRTYGTNGEDLLMGCCVYSQNNNTLISLDGDDYSLEDEIFDYAMCIDKDNKEQYLAVWYGTEWSWV